MTSPPLDGLFVGERPHPPARFRRDLSRPEMVSSQCMIGYENVNHGLAVKLHMPNQGARRSQ